MGRLPTRSDTGAEDVEVWNREDANDLERPKSRGAYEIVVAARDWTVETIVQQIRQGNIDLDPDFQRRNAWRDHRRSRLIESFILGFPVPQIVLAENPRRRKSFVVIDGKQRLMTIAGFYLPEYRAYWTQPRFSGLDILESLNRVAIEEFLEADRFDQLRRQLSNADIRTTVISGVKDEGVLYDIFYRINTGSVPLSSQELRQVLNRGAFAKYLLAVTSQANSIWRLLRIDAPDSRLRDVELLLRLIAWTAFSESYAGNMKQFLDDTMKDLNRDWTKQRSRTERQAKQILLGVDGVTKVFGEYAGRKYKDGRFERSLNRALFEVQAYYFSTRAIRDLAKTRKTAVVAAFKELCADPEFLSAIESTTKSVGNTRTRFDAYRGMLQRVLKRSVPSLKIGEDSE